MSRNGKIAVAAAAGLATLLVLVVIVFAVVRGSNSASTAPPTGSVAPTSPTSPTEPRPATSQAGWVSDPTLRSVTIPELPAEGHGCLASSVTLVDGHGKGSGVVGNGDATPALVHLAGDPLVGRFTSGGPLLRIFPLYCLSRDAAADISATVDLAMIDVAVVDMRGNAVRMNPSGAFDVVAASMDSAEPIYFPVFDPASLKLNGYGANVVFSGSTSDTASKRDEIFDFMLTITANPTYSDVDLAATSTKVRTG